MKTIYGNFTNASQKMVEQAIYKEPLQLRFMIEAANIIPEINELLDAGSNLGIYSVFAARSGAFKAINAFEPSPDTYIELQKNIELNRSETSCDIVAHNLALSQCSGELLFEQRQKFGTGNRISEERGTNTITVQTAPLDALLDSKTIFRNIYAKIDVEGHELDVLSGAEKSVRDRFAIVQIESWPGKIGHRTEVKNFFAQNDFELIFRAKGDHFFLHNNFVQYKDDLQEVFWSYFHRCYRAISSIGKRGWPALRDNQLRSDFLALFNDHPNVRLPPTVQRE